MLQAVTILLGSAVAAALVGQLSRFEQRQCFIAYLCGRAWSFSQIGIRWSKAAAWETAARGRRPLISCRQARGYSNRLSICYGIHRPRKVACCRRRNRSSRLRKLGPNIRRDLARRVTLASANNGVARSRSLSGSLGSRGLPGGDPYGGASWHSQAPGSRGLPGGDSRDGAVYGAPHSPLSDGEVALAQGRHDDVWPTDEGCRTLIRR